METRERSRRRFLKEGAALAGLAAMAGVPSVSSAVAGPGTPGERAMTSTDQYGVRSRFENSSRLVFRAGAWSRDAADYPLSTPLEDLTGIITPSGLHFRNSHGYPAAEIDPKVHRLLIHGMVDRPLIFTVDEIKLLPSVTRIHFIECQGNSAPGWTGAAGSHGSAPATLGDLHGRTACSEWTGVPLSILLKEAGVQAGAIWVDAEGADVVKFTHSIPLEKAMQDETLVVYGQNGEALRPEQGYPLRLLVPGFEGTRNVKWLRRLRLADQPQMSRWATAMYVSARRDGKTRWFNLEMGVKSIITFPCIGKKLPRRGLYEINGLAWSGGGAVRKVEISTDRGRTWQQAQLQDPVHRFAHTRFRLPWNWNGEETVLQSRCTDERGTVQPTVSEYAKVVGLDLDSLKSTWDHHFNAIYPVKVTTDGSVENALFI